MFIREMVKNFYSLRDSRSLFRPYQRSPIICIRNVYAKSAADGETEATGMELPSVSAGNTGTLDLTVNYQKKNKLKFRKSDYEK